MLLFYQKQKVYGIFAGLAALALLTGGCALQPKNPDPTQSEGEVSWLQSTLGLPLKTDKSQSNEKTVGDEYTVTKKASENESELTGKASEKETTNKKTAIPEFQRFYDFAVEQFRSNQFQIAEFYLKRSLIHKKDHRPAVQLLPWSYFYQKRYNKALLAFEKAHIHDPDDPDPVIGMGWCYFSMQSYDQALEKFEKALSLSANSFQAQKGTAFVHLAMGHIEKAKEVLGNLYSVYDRDWVMIEWEQWHKEKPGTWMDVAPSDWNESSLFTLKVEQPRYNSVLFTYPRESTHPDLENAWRLYNKQFYKRAVKIFESLVEPQKPKGFFKEPKDPALLTLDAKNGLAWSWLKTGQILKAQKLFTEMQETWPRFPGVVQGLKSAEAALNQKSRFARYYFDLNKYQIAETKLATLNQDYPEWSLPYSMLGWIHLKRGQESEAQGWFETALMKDSQDTQALEGMQKFTSLPLSNVFRGDDALKQGDYKKASYYYWDYIRKHPVDGPLPSMLARAYSGMGFSQLGKRQYELAIHNFDQLQSIPGFKFDRNKGLGLAYYQLGFYEKAAQHLIVADTVKENQEDLVHKLDWSVLRSWDIETARAYFEEKVVKKPLRPIPYLGLGWIHYKSGDPNRGIEYFLKSISLDPEMIQTVEFKDMLNEERFGWQVYNRLAWEYYHDNQSNKAFQLFELALQRRPRSSEALKGLGYVLFRQGDYARAEAVLRKCVKRNPNTHPVEETIEGDEAGTQIQVRTSAQTLLARSLLAQNKPEEALHWFLVERSRNPEWTEVWDGLGWAYLKLDRLAESRQAFLKSIKAQPLNPKSHKGLKEVKYQMVLKKM